MEDKKLNFNLPLLSVRRFSSKRKNEILQSSSFKSDLISDPLRNPGSVPFVWEQSPGKPKYERKSSQKLPIVPKLPPGGVLKPKKQYLDVITQGFYVAKGSTQEFETSKDSKKVRSNSGDDGNEEHSDIDYDEYENMSYKVCGLLPHFCLRGSNSLVNPVPGLSLRTRLPVSSADTACVGFSAVDAQKKGLVSFRELLAHEKENEKENEADLEKPIIEKTLFVDTIHKMETTKSNFIENDKGIFGISQIPTVPFKSDLLAVKSKHDKEMIIQTGVYKDPKVDYQQVNVCGSELPPPPPLPKSPPDSWLLRTLPYVSTKNRIFTLKS